MTASLLIGFALGWLGSMPIAGAISFFVCRRGLDGHLARGLAIAAGAAVAEAAWCTAIVLGADELLDRWPTVINTARSLGGALLIVLGVVFYLRGRIAARRLAAGDDTSAPQASAPRLRDEFRLGVTLAVINPAIPFNWFALITVAISFGLDPGQNPAAFGLGLGLGVVAWFGVLLRLITAWRERLHVGMLVRLQQGVAVLLVAGGLLALWLIWS